ncbi:MAG TPA: response regulator [Actinomycetota bacterium]|nr:response regulator [Actinomycetota bacterium]
MVIDDDPAIREMLAFSLGLEGYDVSTAPDGTSALNALRIERPDAIVLDVMMPLLNGYQVLQRLRELDGHGTTPVIFLTAKATDEEVWEGWSKGADSYITKPVDMDVLIGEIERVVTDPSVAA